MPWIVRYAAELKYSNLLIVDNSQVDIDFEGIGVNQVASLLIARCKIRNLQLPSQLRHLELIQTMWERDVRIPTTLTRFQIRNSYVNSPSSQIMAALPRENLQRLYILDCNFYMASCPVFPNVKKLCWRTSNKNALVGILTKFPGLRRLDVENNILDLQPLIGSQITKLRISSIYLSDLMFLRDIPLTHLDVQYCPMIANFDAVRHVANVIKFKPSERVSDTMSHKNSK
jgi:hypothetical protein